MVPTLYNESQVILDPLFRNLQTIYWLLKPCELWLFLKNNIWLFGTSFEYPCCEHYTAPFMGYERLIFWFLESPTTGWHEYKVKKHFHCLIISIYFLPNLLNNSQMIRSTINFSKLLLYVTLICGDLWWRSEWTCFHFIKPVMSTDLYYKSVVMPDKAAFVSDLCTALLCVQLLQRKPLFLALQKQHLVAKN